MLTLLCWCRQCCHPWQFLMCVQSHPQCRQGQGQGHPWQEEVKLLFPLCKLSFGSDWREAASAVRAKRAAMVNQEVACSSS